MDKPLQEIELGNIKPVKTGKVRSIYDLGEYFLFVATDRISAYDWVLPTPITDKGKVLTQVSRFWFSYLADVVSNHFISSNIEDFPEEIKAYKDQLDGRSMLVKKAEVIPVECIVRGYISGSAWKEYQSSGTVNGEGVRSGLVESEAFPEPIFTPSTKAESGHDENISFQEMCDTIGEPLSKRLRDISLKLFTTASHYLDSKGIILADTKFEFGLIGDEIILIDEVLTPDSSRFWPKSDYEKGRGQKSYDKQFVRDYLTDIKWDKKAPVPSLPEDVVAKTREKYLEISRIIMGKETEISQ